MGQLNFSLTENFYVENFLPKIVLTKSIHRSRKGIFTLTFWKPGWAEQSKVMSERILKRNFFMQTDVQYELISDYLYTHNMRIRIQRESP